MVFQPIYQRLQFLKERIFLIFDYTFMTNDDLKHVFNRSFIITLTTINRYEEKNCKFTIVCVYF